MRVVMLSDCGTHASIDAAVGGFNTGEPNLAIGMAGSAAGMLVMSAAASSGRSRTPPARSPLSWRTSSTSCAASWTAEPVGYEQPHGS